MKDSIRVLVCGAGGRMGQEVIKAVKDAEGMEVVAGVEISPQKCYGSVPQETFVSNSLPVAIKTSKPDVMVDFTHPDSVMDNLTKAIFAGVHCVVGTTGLSATDIMTLETHTRHNRPTNVFIAPNFAIGAVLMMHFAQQAARYMPDSEIVELHHDQKFDSPSGTALRTAKLVAEAREPGRENKALLAYDPSSTEIEGRPERGRLHGEPRLVPIHSVRLPGLVAHQEVIFGGQGQTLTIRHDSIDRTSFMPGVVLAIREIASQPQGVTVGLEKLLGL